MKLMLKNGLRFILVTLGIVLLTSFTIDATDTLRGSQTALGILSQNLSGTECREGMVLVEGETPFCIDVYEVSTSKECVYEAPLSAQNTAANIADVGCIPVSQKDKNPWTYVAQPQAVQLCAKAGKRLPTNQEWFVAALGTTDSSDACNISGVLKTTGSSPECFSGSGAFDTVGNVWELVQVETVDGQYNGRALPAEGFVSLADEAGVALETSTTSSPIYNEDYFWAKDTGRYTFLRGGYHGSKKDGGIYTIHAKTDLTFASAAIGFRCVEDLQ